MVHICNEGVTLDMYLKSLVSFFPHVILVGDKVDDKAPRPKELYFFLIIDDGDDDAAILLQKNALLMI